MHNHEDCQDCQAAFIRMKNFCEELCREMGETANAKRRGGAIACANEIADLVYEDVYEIFEKETLGDA